MRTILRWTRYVVPLVVLAISLYFLFSGRGPYQKTYSIVSTTIIFIIGTVVVVRIFFGADPSEAGMSTNASSQRKRPSKLLLAFGLILFFALGPAWMLLSPRFTDSAPLVFIPSLSIVVIGAIFSGYNVYLWLLPRVSRRL
jgi:hypothetical protein